MKLLHHDRLQEIGLLLKIRYSKDHHYASNLLFNHVLGYLMVRTKENTRLQTEKQRICAPTLPMRLLYTVYQRRSL